LTHPGRCLEVFDPEYRNRTYMMLVVNPPAAGSRDRIGSGPIVCMRPAGQLIAGLL
jgi:hypothetical protein